MMDWMMMMFAHPPQKITGRKGPGAFPSEERLRSFTLQTESAQKTKAH